MTGDSGGLTNNVGQYALEQYRQQGGGGLASLLTMGMSDIVAATKALSAASEAQALSVDPNVVDAMLRKLTEMQDSVEKIRRRADLLTTATPLGGGYAQEIGQVNAQLGDEVVNQVIPEMVKAIDDLKTQIDKSRSSYQNVDEAKAQTLNNL
ncbi:hypothetical protein ALI22I_00385 [Saccharothrix sp. ALI-22-I]|uniref:hypothetical protein n=1 Tax=Saccharothrix sp. ALI-22-I TaxID=1933778 RepID=UPI00097C185D|nr:hypothetical protein [Saccharothrix sp. ALI-22-I]ONI93039.1 hypothetical protein ALI22I_00385 [Saccharothrix sp. ALI-22-I]